MRRVLKIVSGVMAGTVVLAAAAAGGWVLRNLKAADWGIAALDRAGFTERQVRINGHRINYGAVPVGDDLPPLLLIHGQGSDWKGYYPVLPDLAEHYRIFAVDVYGHGSSEATPGEYSATEIGTDLATFVEEVIGEPVVVTGHSSGGQLAAWLAGHRPDLVRGVVLEDPPMFTTLLPRAEQTWNWVDLATSCHTFLASGEQDWIAYNFAHARMWQFFGDAKERIVAGGLKRHAKHPDEPITLLFMPPTFNDFQRSMASYDPHFGDAFYTGSWDTGFDHEQTLRSIEDPAVLIHANFSYGDDGILQGAMDDQDAARAAKLIKDVEFVSVDSGHNVHGEKPNEFVDILIDFRSRI